MGSPDRQQPEAAVKVVARVYRGAEAEAEATARRVYHSLRRLTAGVEVLVARGLIGGDRCVVVCAEPLGLAYIVESDWQGGEPVALSEEHAAAYRLRFAMADEGGRSFGEGMRIRQDGTLDLG